MIIRPGNVIQRRLDAQAEVQRIARRVKRQDEAVALSTVAKKRTQGSGVLTWLFCACVAGRCDLQCADSSNTTVLPAFFT